MQWGGRTFLVTLVAAGAWFLATPLDSGILGSAPETPIAVEAPPIEAPPLTVEQLSARVEPTVVTISALAGFSGVAGTGFVVAPDGIVVTNFHVVEDATEISATHMGNGLIYDATVLGYDKTRDVAVMQLATASDLPVVEPAADSPLDVGDAVTAVGNVSGGGVLVPAPGKVTALDQQVLTRSSVDGSRNTLERMIQVDADVRSGDSGGPLFDAWGRVVGVNTAGLSEEARTGSPDSPPQAPEAYAVPIADALAVVEQVVRGESSGTVHVGPTPYLGVTVRDVGALENNPSMGAHVMYVDIESPSEATGLVSGDVIVAIDGAAIRSSNDLVEALVDRYPGDVLQVDWIADDGTARTGAVTLGQGTPTA